jgi:hypothetical protein
MGFGNSANGMSSGLDRLVYMSNNGQINFGVYDGGPVTIQSPDSYNDGTWHEVVATQGADGMNLYVDGQMVASNDTSQAQQYLTVGYWHVGADYLANWPDSPTSNYFAGTISDVSIYDTELSPTEIQNQYAASPAS